MSALPPFQPTPFFNNNQPGFVHSVEPGMLKGYIQLHNCGELLYFHFSQVMGNPTHLCAGQYVDVEVLRDMQSGLLRTHKVYMHMHSGYGAGQPFHQNHPYQRQSSQQQQQLPPLMQQPPGQVPPQSPSPSSSSRLRKGALYSIGMERQRGKVDSEPAARRSQSPTANCPGTPNSHLGRIVYEKNSECFFVQFSPEDVEDERPVRQGDEVSFLPARDSLSKNMRALSIKLEKPASVNKVQGLIKTIKDSFGFIERADAAEMVFFHFSELSPGYSDQLSVGCPVECVLQNRQGKEVATQVKLLPPGSVSFVVVQGEECRGVIRKPVLWVTSQKRREPSNDDGEILYHSPTDGLVSLAYNSRDQVGAYSVCPGDQVTFNIAIDKRTGQKRATNVAVATLNEVQRDKNARDKGVVGHVQDQFGYIECCSRDLQAVFHVCEVMDQNRAIQQGDEVEYTPVLSKDKDSGTDSISATRIQVLPTGSVKFDTITSQVYEGVVAEELTRTPDKAVLDNPFRLLCLTSESCGNIHYTGKTGKLGVVPFYYDPEEQEVEFGDRVQFMIAKVKRTREQRAVGMKIIQRQRDIRFKGFISRLIKKEKYGFIESEEHDCEIFFPFTSIVEGDPMDLCVLDEVEYCITRKEGKARAERVVRLAQGTISQDEVLPPGVAPGECLNGEVVRVLRSNSNDYEGCIQYFHPEAEGGSPLELPYTVTSLNDTRNLPKLGEQVMFKVGVCGRTGARRAINVVVKRETLKGKIDTIKDQYGFITYYADGERTSIFFHKSNTEGGGEGANLRVGDEVCFVVTTHHKNQKKQAICVKKTGSPKRPERLSRKSLTSSKNQHTSNLVVVVRQPRGPDETRGFKNFN